MPALMISATLHSIIQLVAAGLSGWPRAAVLPTLSFGAGAMLLAVQLLMLLTATLCGFQDALFYT